MSRRNVPTFFSESTSTDEPETEDIREKISTDEQKDDTLADDDDDDDSNAETEASTKTSFQAAKKRYQAEISRLQASIKQLKRERWQKMKSIEPEFELKKHFDLDYPDEVKRDGILKRLQLTQEWTKVRFLQANSHTTYISEGSSKDVLVTEWDILGETHGLRFHVVLEVKDHQLQSSEPKQCPPQGATRAVEALPQILKMDVEVEKHDLSLNMQKALKKFCKYKAFDQCVRYLKQYASRPSK